MVINFLMKSRRGTVFFSRRRVPKVCQGALGKSCLVRSLETADRKLAITRARTLAVHTDQIFERLAMAKKSNPNVSNDDIWFDYTMKISFSDEGRPTYIDIDTQPEEQEAVNSAIKAAMSSFAVPASDIALIDNAIPFDTAFTEYYQHAQIKPQTKATYRSKLDHAKHFFGEDKDVLRIAQGGIFKYYSHILQTIGNSTSQGLYLSTVTSFLKWHRRRISGAATLTIKTLLPHGRPLPEQCRNMDLRREWHVCWC